MKKQIKQYGNSAVIVLDSEDMRVYNLNIGDVLDLELCKIKPFKPLPKSKNLTKDIKEEIKWI